jgi:xylulokinase
MKSFLVGIDIGTTLTKGVLIDTHGSIIAEAARPCLLYSDYPNWAEEDPAQWWANSVAIIRQLLLTAKAAGAKVEAIGVSGMVPALVLLDRDGKPLRRSIQQNDARSGPEIEQLKREFDEAVFFHKTGGSINQQVMAPKLSWLRRHEPEVLERGEHLLGSYDYINYRLTGTLCVEHNWALESGLYNLSTQTWDSELLSLAGIGRSLLPEIQPSSAVIGRISKAAASETGLDLGVPVVAGSADHVASAFVAGTWSNGDLLIKFGGAGDILYSSDTLITDQRLFIDYHLIPDKYLLNGCMATSGSLVQWYVQQFAGADLAEAQAIGISVYELLDQKIAGIPPGSDGLVLLPYFLGEKTPLHDPSARGTLFGLDLHHDRNHVYKAILESVAFGFRHHLDVLAERKLPVARVLASDGGARSGVWLQIAADVLRQPVYRVLKHPGSSLGAAFLAGKGMDIITDWEQISAYVSLDHPFLPDPSRSAAYDRYYEIYRALYQNLKPLFPKLTTARNLSLSS